MADPRPAVLFLTASPASFEPLRLADEIRDVKEALRMADFRDEVNFDEHPSTTRDDVLQALNETRPRVVHFAGHGNSDALVLVDDADQAAVVSRAAFVQALESFADSLRVVVFNSSNSEAFAAAATAVVPCAIGTSAAVEDSAARLFARAFYRALAFGHSVANAFLQGRASLSLHGRTEADAYRLHAKQGVRPEDVFLVDPIPDKPALTMWGGADGFVPDLAGISPRSDVRTSREAADAPPCLSHDERMRRLERLLEPLSFDDEKSMALRHFTGRKRALDVFDQWLEDKKAAPVFWVEAEPGFGKTALSAWLCRERRNICAVHFCHHAYEDRVDASRCIRSLAYQLANAVPTYAALLQEGRVEALLRSAGPRALFNRLITEPLNRSGVEPERPLVVLVDGIDETLRAGRSELADVLASEWERTPAWLRLVLTSRPERALRTVLQAWQHTDLTDITDNRQDILVFLRETLDLAVSPATLESIATRSDECFLFAECMRREIAEGRLRPDQGDAFPNSMGGFYWSAFHRQFGSTDEYEQQVLPVLELMVAAREPLSLELATTMLGWDPRVTRDVVGVLGSLFHAKDRLEFFHKSLADWLLDPEKSGPFAIDIVSARERMTAAGWQAYQRRGEKLPAHFLRHLLAYLTSAGRVDDAVTLAFDGRYLEARVEAGQVFDLLGDLERLADPKGSDPRRSRLLPLLAMALRRDVHFITAHPECLFQCLWNSGWWYDSSEVASHYVAPAGGWPAPPPWERGEPRLSTWLEAWRREKEARAPFVWVRSLRPPKISLGSAQIAELRGHAKEARSVAFTHDGRWLVSGGLDGSVRVWDTSTWSQQLVLDTGAEVNSVACHPSCPRVAVASGSAVVLFDVLHGKEQVRFTGHEGTVNGVAFSPDGSRLASGAHDETAIVWSLAEADVVSRVTGHAGPVWSVAFAGARLLSGSFDRTIRAWDIESGVEAWCLAGHDSTFALAVAPDESWLASAHDRDTLQFWDLATGTLLSTHPHPTGTVSLALSRDGTLLASGGVDIRIWNPVSRELLQVLEGVKAASFGLAFSPDGTRLASASDDGMVRLWRVDQPSEHIQVSGHSASVSGITSITASPDGLRFASGAGDNTVRIWDAASARQERCLEGHTHDVLASAFSPEGTRLASASKDNSVRTWHLATGALSAVLQEHGDSVAGVAFSPDGTLLASASHDRTARVWDAAGGSSRRVLTGHQRELTCVVFSLDGQTVATGAKDGTVRLWDVASGLELRRFFTAYREARALAFVEPDTLVVDTADAALEWRLADGRLVTLRSYAQGHAPRAAGAERDGLRLVRSGDASVVERVLSREPIGRVAAGIGPQVARAAGKIWAAHEESHLLLLALEGPVPPSTRPAPRAPTQLTADFLYARGVAELWSRDVEAAAASLSEAIRRCDTNGEYRRARGEAYSCMGPAHHDDALADFTEALRLGGASSRAHQWRGVQLLERGHTAEALVDFALDVRHHPRDGNAHFWQGFAMLAQGEAAASKKCLARAGELDPEAPRVWFWLGVACRVLGEHQEAQACWEKTRTDGGRKVGLANWEFSLARLKLLEGDASEFRRSYLVALSGAMSASTVGLERLYLRVLGELFPDQQGLREGAEWFARTIAEENLCGLNDPAGPGTSLGTRARLAQAREQWDEALRWHQADAQLRERIEDLFGCALARGCQAGILLRRCVTEGGDLTEVLPLFETIHRLTAQLAGEQRAVLAATELQHAIVHHALGDSETAATLYAGCVDLAPEAFDAATMRLCVWTRDALRGAAPPSTQMPSAVDAWALLAATCRAAAPDGETGLLPFAATASAVNTAFCQAFAEQGSHLVVVPSGWRRFGLGAELVLGLAFAGAGIALTARWWLAGIVGVPAALLGGLYALLQVHRALSSLDLVRCVKCNRFAWLPKGGALPCGCAD